MRDLVARLRELAEALEGCEWEVPLCSRETCMRGADEIERLTRGINKLSRVIEGNYGMATVDHTDGRWYVYNSGGECNDDRHADTLLDLVRKLGGSTDDQRKTDHSG